MARQRQLSAAMPTLLSTAMVNSPNTAPEAPTVMDALEARKKLARLAPADTAQTQELSRRLLDCDHDEHRAPCLTLSL